MHSFFFYAKRQTCLLYNGGAFPWTKFTLCLYKTKLDFPDNGLLTVHHTIMKEEKQAVPLN